MARKPTKSSLSEVGVPPRKTIVLASLSPRLLPPFDCLEEEEEEEEERD
jgi:hypothetical protein